MFMFRKKLSIPSASEALPGRDTPLGISGVHFVNGASMVAPYPAGAAVAVFGVGCFWGAERCFWQTGGVLATSVGYAGGSTPNPTYEEVCTGMTGHNEVVQVIFDEATLSFEQLLSVFWEAHNPTQGMRQGNDAGTQYRSGIYTYDDAQVTIAKRSLKLYQKALSHAGLGSITTEIVPVGEYYFAEEYHQQYLAKNPAGYCGIGGTGVACPVGVL
ncbi:MAG: peptide-methionine (S)-S-oxide reductase MsrA [Chromatiales bacterium]|jgi:peptide-methionine (S)-S-oxide reductase|nr:peptide-methionine (S)-S-oxide reductase MsrA [Chromatiales bacterium]